MSVIGKVGVVHGLRECDRAFSIRQILPERTDVVNKMKINSIILFVVLFGFRTIPLDPVLLIAGCSANDPSPISYPHLSAEAGEPDHQEQDDFHGAQFKTPGS